MRQMSLFDLRPYEMRKFFCYRCGETHLQEPAHSLVSTLAGLPGGLIIYTCVDCHKAIESELHATKKERDQWG
jgi:DNA-directed RNA polymerase subunit RPC12/RpoP